RFLPAKTPHTLPVPAPRAAAAAASKLPARQRAHARLLRYRAADRRTCHRPAVHADADHATVSRSASARCPEETPAALHGLNRTPPDAATERGSNPGPYPPPSRPIPSSGRRNDGLRPCSGGTPLGSPNHSSLTH